MSYELILPQNPTTPTSNLATQSQELDQKGSSLIFTSELSKKRDELSDSEHQHQEHVVPDEEAVDDLLVELSESFPLSLSNQDYLLKEPVAAQVSNTRQATSPTVVHLHSVEQHNDAMSITRLFNNPARSSSSSEPIQITVQTVKVDLLRQDNPVTKMNNGVAQPAIDKQQDTTLLAPSKEGVMQGVALQIEGSNERGELEKSTNNTNKQSVTQPSAELNLSLKDVESQLAKLGLSPLDSRNSETHRQPEIQEKSVSNKDTFKNDKIINELKSPLQDSIEKLELGERKELRITVRPAYLGEIKIELVRNVEGIKMAIIASSEAVSNYLNQHRSEILEEASRGMSGFTDTQGESGSDEQSHQKSNLNSLSDGEEPVDEPVVIEEVSIRNSIG